METETFAALTMSGRSPEETENSGGTALEGTHWADDNRFSRGRNGENRIVWKCMAELGISGGTTADAEGPMASTNRALAFGEK